MAETIDCMVNDSKIPMADVGKVLGITSRADYKVYTRAMQAVLGHFGFTLSQDPTLHRPRPYLLQSDLNKLLKKRLRRIAL
jgi:hypothetical protein